MGATLWTQLKNELNRK